MVVVNDPVPGPPPKVVNPPKKPLSEKQLAHLARIREKSNAARRAKRDMKAAQKEKEAADFEAYRNQQAAPPQAPQVYNLRSTAQQYKGLSAEEIKNVVKTTMGEVLTQERQLYAQREQQREEKIRLKQEQLSKDRDETVRRKKQHDLLFGPRIRTRR